MRSDAPRLRKIGSPDTVRFGEAKSRGARDLGECAVCERLFDPALLGPMASGPHLLRWDRRPRGPVGWRIGHPDEGKMLLPDGFVRACGPCGGAVGCRLEEDRTPLRSGRESVTWRIVPGLAPAEPLWKAAKRAWAETRETDPWFELCGRRGGK